MRFELIIGTELQLVAGAEAFSALPLGKSNGHQISKFVLCSQATNGLVSIGL